MNNEALNNTQNENNQNVQNNLNNNIPIGSFINQNNNNNGTILPGVITPPEDKTQPIPIAPQQPEDKTQQVPIVPESKPVVVNQPPLEETPTKESENTTEKVEEKKEEEKTSKKVKKKKEKKEKESVPKDSENKKSSFPTIFIIIILLMGIYIVYSNLSHKAEIKQLNYECTPVSTTKEEKELDLNSTIVQDLYSKVQTNIKEDLAETELNDSMKLYLAYRQITPSKIYDSNCNLFSKTDLISYTCVDNNNYTPQAFKEETLQIELKKLFGENTNIENADIQLGKSCVGGYNYIEKRGEYVQGTCTNYSATSYKATKKLSQAISKKSTIILKEEVKYYGTESQKVPSNLKSGTYVYTFKLDTNYNYVYVSKELEEKY